MGLTTQTYDIVSRIAVGNGALVYRAVEKATLRQVALKLLTQDGELDHRLDLDALFAAGAQLRQISGAHVCQLLNAYQDEDGPVLVYEFANGINGSDFPHEKKLDPVQALDVAAQLISSLRSGERQRTPHGDLKPSNIVFVEAGGGRPYTFVLDWGLAAFRLETPADSLPFFAPERLAGAPASHQADLFSAGAVLFYLYTGKLLVGGVTRDGLARAWQEVNPAVLAELRPDLPAKLVQWVCSLLDLDPAKRPPSAVEAGTALAALNPPPPLVPPETIRPRPVQRSGIVPAPSGIIAPAQSGIRPAPVPAALPAVTASRQPVATTTAAQAKKPAAPPAGKKSSAAFLAISLTVTAVAAAGGAWWFLRDRDKTDSIAPAERAGVQPSRTPPPSVTAPLPPLPQRPAAANGREVVGTPALTAPAPKAAPPKPATAQAPPANTPPANAAAPTGDPHIFLLERFEYPAGAGIAAQPGGAGWAAPWQGGDGKIEAASIEFPRYPAAGGSLSLAPAKAEQTWARRAGPLSLFVRDAAKGDRWYFGVLLHQGDGTPAPNGEVQINPFDITDPFNLVRVVVEDRGPVLRISLNDPKAFLEAPDDGKPIYLLMRVDLDKPKLGNWDLGVTAWVNPDFDQTSGSKAGKGITTKMTYVPVPAELGLLIRTKRTQTAPRLDEIRFGRHYENMVFKPMPPTAQPEQK